MGTRLDSTRLDDMFQTPTFLWIVLCVSVQVEVAGRPCMVAVGPGIRDQSVGGDNLFPFPSDFAGAVFVHKEDGWVTEVRKVDSTGWTRRLSLPWMTEEERGR